MLSVFAHEHMGSEADPRTVDAMHHAAARAGVPLEEQRQARAPCPLGDGMLWVVYCDYQRAVPGELEAHFAACCCGKTCRRHQFAAWNEGLHDAPQLAQVHLHVQGDNEVSAQQIREAQSGKTSPVALRRRTCNE